MNEPKSERIYFAYGPTTLYACQYDQRFSYYAYVPKSYSEGKSHRYSLAVVVHGTERAAATYRDEFADFSEETNTIIVAPLFPAGITEPRELSSYKFVDFGGIRFDLILLAMIDEVCGTYGLADKRFLLHGFSGGGHFVHRFYYLHPEKLLGVSIGAPGFITYLDETRPWYAGISDFEQRFGMRLPIEEMRRVPVQMVIGGEDLETWEINQKDSPLWLEGLDAYGQTRIERLRGLRDNFQNNGIDVRYDEVPGVSHEGFKILEPVKAFFKDALAARSLEGDVSSCNPN
ncbi:hypothetical protein ACFLFF_11480 [Brevibacillus reuszeri]|uniref:hypothetical protein n=1 Tax=Brevibacillus reuszeri TaxID=54915 RepID=UPI00366ABC39